jgi:hypothetical protein
METNMIGAPGMTASPLHTASSSDQALSRRYWCKGIIAAAALSPALLAVSPSRADTIYQDNFARGSVGAPQNLAESPPAPTDVGTNTWQISYTAPDSATAQTDGSEAVFTGESGHAQSAYLPFSPQPSTTYVATVTLLPTGTPSANDWLAMGIGDGDLSKSIAVNSTNGVGVLYRGADSGGTVYSFVESAPPVGSSFGHAEGDPDTFTITLTTPSNLSSQSWNVSFSDTLGNLGGTESESFSPGANSSLWTEIYLIQDGAQNGDALNFSLVTVPEPAELHLLGMAAPMLLLRRRASN